LRSRIVLLLSVCFYASAAVTELFAVFALSSIASDLQRVEIGVLFYVICGSAVLVYWLFDRPDYSETARPLGISLLTVENGLVGLVLVVEAFVLLFLPVLGILGVIIGAIGLGFFTLAKALWEGKEWAQQVMLVLSGLSIALSLVLLLQGLGSPILALFQFWYLRRPHVNNFFSGSEQRKAQRDPMLSPWRTPIPDPPSQAKNLEAS
jgi:hypothetical protein